MSDSENAINYDEFIMLMDYKHGAHDLKRSPHFDDPSQAPRIKDRNDLKLSIEEVKGLHQAGVIHIDGLEDQEPKRGRNVLIPRGALAREPS